MVEEAKFRCVLRKVEPSLIPNVYILHFDCENGIGIVMDIHREVKTVDEGDRVEITISKKIPPYEEGKDFLARGYVFAKKVSKESVREGDRQEEYEVYKLLISLWGFLVVLKSRDPSIHNLFDYMDEIYMHIKKL